MRTERIENPEILISLPIEQAGAFEATEFSREWEWYSVGCGTAEWATKAFASEEVARTATIAACGPLASNWAFVNLTERAQEQGEGLVFSVLPTPPENPGDENLGYLRCEAP